VFLKNRSIEKKIKKMIWEETLFLSLSVIGGLALNFMISIGLLLLLGGVKLKMQGR